MSLVRDIMNRKSLRVSFIDFNSLEYKLWHSGYDTWPDFYTALGMCCEQGLSQDPSYLSFGQVVS